MTEVYHLDKTVFMPFSINKYGLNEIIYWYNNTWLRLL